MVRRCQVNRASVCLKGPAHLITHHLVVMCVVISPNNKNMTTTRNEQQQKAIGNGQWARNIRKKMPRHATTAESSKKRYKIWEISLSSSVCLPVVGSQTTTTRANQTHTITTCCVLHWRYINTPFKEVQVERRKKERTDSLLKNEYCLEMPCSAMCSVVCLASRTRPRESYSTRLGSAQRLRRTESTLIGR